MTDPHPNATVTHGRVYAIAAPAKVATLTTEEEGIAMLFGAWLGGEKGVLLMQSSGVGNCINMLSVAIAHRTPCPMIVTRPEGPFPDRRVIRRPGTASAGLRPAPDVAPGAI